MNNRIRLLVTAILAGLMTSAGSIWAQANDHGRISYSTDDALILGEGDEDWSFAGINTLVLEGDRVWADDSGAIELEFPGGYYVRLADGSEVEVVDLPPDGVIRAWVGSFYVQRLDGARGDLTFDTGAARFNFDPGTVARFDVLTDGATTLSVVDGRVSVFTNDGQVMDAGRGLRTYIDPGLLPSPPERYNSADDTFDVWNASRVSYIYDATEPEPIRQSSAAPIGVRDLDNYGDWVYVDNQRYWRPIYVNNYVPYRQGYWSYVPGHGHVWVGYYPFDYITGHYGYWNWNRRHGWLWSYHPVYAPARVVSVYYGDILFWAPATRYGYPVYGSHFDFAIGGFHFSLGFSSFAYYDHVFHHYHKNYYYKPYYCQPLHRHVINSQPAHARPQLWNHHTRGGEDWQNVRRNTDIADFRGEPSERVRGFTRSERGEARTVAARLEGTRRNEFRDGERMASNLRTPLNGAQREARVRDIGSIRDPGTRVAPPEDRTLARTDNDRVTRTPSIDRGGERGVRVERTPAPSERITTRDGLNTPERGGAMVRERERTTLPTDRGTTTRLVGRDSGRATTPTDRLREDVNRGETRTVQPDRGTTRTLSPERGVERSTVEDRGRVSTDRSVSTTDRGTRTIDRSEPTDRGGPAIERPRSVISPDRGISRSNPSSSSRISSVESRDQSESIETGRSSARSVSSDRGYIDRGRQETSINRLPESSEPRSTNYRQAIPRETVQSGPSRSYESPPISRSVPDRGPVAPSTRGSAPAAPMERSMSPSAPTRQSAPSMPSAPSSTRAGTATRRM